MTPQSTFIRTIFQQKSQYISFYQIWSHDPLEEGCLNKKKSVSYEYMKNIEGRVKTQRRNSTIDDDGTLKVFSN